MAIYGDRVAGLPQLLHTLYYHERGMRVADLAAEVGRPETEVRETLRVYHLTDLADHLPDLVARPAVIEFVEDDREVGDAATAPVVRLVSGDPGRELGVSYAPLPDLARLYRISRDALALYGDDSVLASAVHKLHESLLPSMQVLAPEPFDRLADLNRASDDGRQVRVVYARAWSPEIVTRVIDPYGLIRTRRGWELDAAPGDEHSELTTYLVSNIREHEVLESTFAMPDGMREMVMRHRVGTAVTLDMPHHAHWVVDKYAERVDLVEDNVRTARLIVHVLPPVRLRIGLMLVAGGPDARVVDPPELRDAGAELARSMLAHYS